MQDPDRRDSDTGANGTITAGGALLGRLKALGVDYIFANSGTDFPPIIEGLAEAEAKGIALPQAIVIPHESAAMGMAHGYFLATGRAQAVMAHTNVGLANCAIGAINAATENVPILLFSGRTPVTESGRTGSRTVPIGWGQEMRDQAALVREAVKWDYEIRFPEQVTDVVDRAYAIATSTPKGPVYISLPREVLCEACPSDTIDAPVRIAPVETAPTSAALEKTARILAAARRPLIIAQRGAGSSEGFAALAALAETWAIPVCQYWAVQLAIATDHPMSVGADVGPWLTEADVVLLIDCMAPWAPASHAPPPGCVVIHAGPDPLYSRTPVRGFPADIALPGETADIVIRLAEAMRPYREANLDACAARRADVSARASRVRARCLAAADADGGGDAITKAWVSRCLSMALENRGASVLSELGCPLEPLTLREHGAWFQEPHSGGLGWSFPAALGMQLADPDRLIVATMGDGSYMFANPVACHQIAEALELPLLLLVLNNSRWDAVRQSVLSIYPDGYAARANRMPLVSLDPSPDFTLIGRASRAWTAQVDSPLDLPGVLAAAIDHVTTTRRQALVEIRVAS